MEIQSYSCSKQIRIKNIILKQQTQKIIHTKNFQSKHRNELSNIDKSIKVIWPLAKNFSVFINKTIQQLQLLGYESFYGVFNIESTLSVENYYQSVGIVVTLLKEKCKNIFQTMSEAQYSFYISLKIKLMKDQANLSDKQVCFQCGTEAKSLKMVFDLQKLFKIDILSLFLKKNYQFKHRYGQYMVTTILQPQSLSNIFQMSKQEIEFYIKKFDEFWDHISYDYQGDFEEIITLACLIEMKYRVSNYLKRDNKKDLNQFRSKLIQLPLSQNMPQSQKQFRYKLCELIFFNNGLSIPKICFSKRAEIIDRLDRFITLPSEASKKAEILKIKARYNISFEAIDQFLYDIENGSQKYVKNIQSMRRIKKAIAEVRWKMLISQKVSDVLEQQIGCKMPYDDLLDDNWMTRQLWLHAFHGYMDLAQVNRIHLKLLEMKNDKMFIFAKLFNYAYKDLFPSSQYSQEELKCLNATFILGTTKDNILFYSIANKMINDWSYGQILKKILLICNKKSFNFVLYEFTLTSSFQWKTFRYLNSYLSNNFNSRIMVVNFPDYFKQHIIADIMIRRIIKGMNPQKVKQNFYVILKAVIKIVIKGLYLEIGQKS